MHEMIVVPFRVVDRDVIIFLPPRTQHRVREQIARMFALGDIQAVRNQVG